MQPTPNRRLTNGGFFVPAFAIPQSYRAKFPACRQDTECHPPIRL